MGRYSRIYVGKLGPYVRERELRERFEEFGPIVSVDLKRGYGFVEYEREKDADDAIYYMDRKYFDGATIIVEPARGTKRERPTTRGPPQRSEHRAKVYNLPRNMSWQDLKDHFRPVAEVIFAECFPGKKSATANIEFNTREEMKRAIDKFDRSSLEGDLIYVEEDTRRSRYSSPGRRSPVRSLSPRRSPLDSRSPRGSPRRSPRRSPSRSPRRSLSPRSPSPRRRSPSPGRSPRPSRDDRSPRRSPSPRRSLSPRRSRSPSPSDRKRRRSESPSGSPDTKRRRTSVDGEY